MLILPDDFELEFEDVLLKIHIHKLGERKVFEVQFPDDRPNLFMSRSVVASGDKMWMAIPEGPRQAEALAIGKHIVKFFQQQQKQQ
jgi:hypothetical protein